MGYIIFGVLFGLMFGLGMLLLFLLPALREDRRQSEASDKETSESE